MPNTLILRALTGDLRGQEFAVPESAHYIIGRSRSCSLRLTGDATVSRQHCLLERDARGVWVQDLGSLNGTLINGTPIARGNVPVANGATYVQSPRQELHDGDELRICNTAFAVCVREPVAATKAKDTMRMGLVVPRGATRLRLVKPRGMIVTKASRRDCPRRDAFAIPECRADVRHYATDPGASRESGEGEGLSRAPRIPLCSIAPALHSAALHPGLHYTVLRTQPACPDLPMCRSDSGDGEALPPSPEDDVV